MAKRKKVEAIANQIDLFAEAEAAKNAPPATEEQVDVIEYKGKKSMILSACAGSGKTFTLVQKIKRLIDDGADPSRIILFSFTKAATLELAKRIGRDDIEIRTIHSYCGKVLTSLQKGKSIVTYMQFINWFKNKNKPGKFASRKDKSEFEETISRMYEEAEYSSSQISAYKLQKESGIKTQLPGTWSDYIKFLKESKSRDMTDLLLDVWKLFKEDRFLKIFKNKYDHVFIDEYQDTSSIQMEVLLSLNAKQYYLVGDKSQSIFSFSGANCKKVEDLLKKRRDTITKNLSINFRSDKAVIENSNKYSILQATANSTSEGLVDKTLMFSLDQLIDILSGPGEVAVLARTNAAIKKLEFQLLRKHIPMRYSNYITEKDIKEFKKGDEMNPQTKRRFEMIKGSFDGSIKKVAAFIRGCHDSKKFITSIHKSKGLEYDTCVVVNSISPDELLSSGLRDKLTDKQFKACSFELDNPEYEEAQNIHYVAVSRAKHKNYFMIYL